jgi:hypothetical protein
MLFAALPGTGMYVALTDTRETLDSKNFNESK